MKINYIEEEDMKIKPLKQKVPKLDHKLISKVGKVLYGFNQAKEVLIKVRLKGGTSIAFFRSEDEDRFDHLKRRIDRDLEEEDDD